MNELVTNTLGELAGVSICDTGGLLEPTPGVSWNSERPEVTLIVPGIGYCIGRPNPLGWARLCEVVEGER